MGEAQAEKTAQAQHPGFPFGLCPPNYRRVARAMAKLPSFSRWRRNNTQTHNPLPPSDLSRPMCQPKISSETEGGGVRGASCANVGTYGPLSLRDQQILASSFADGL